MVIEESKAKKRRCFKNLNKYCAASGCMAWETEIKKTTIRLPEKISEEETKKQFQGKEELYATGVILDGNVFFNYFVETEKGSCAALPKACCHES